jgi:hypothetical protein
MKYFTWQWGWFAFNRALTTQEIRVLAKDSNEYLAEHNFRVEDSPAEIKESETIVEAGDRVYDADQFFDSSNTEEIRNWVHA